MWYIQNGFILVFCIMAVLSCSFDYSSMEEAENNRPDLVMQDVDYVRVTDGSIAFHMQADKLDHFENNHLFQVQNIRFEQFPKGVTEPDTVGSAGFAQFWTTTQDAVFTEGVRIVIPSEDLSVEAKSLQWHNSQKRLLGSQEDQVLLKKSDGSMLVGKGFSADGRSKSWQFTGPVSGIYQEEPTQ